METIIGLCRFFNTVPSVILNEDAEILRMVQLYHLAHSAEDGYGG